MPRNETRNGNEVQVIIMYNNILHINLDLLCEVAYIDFFLLELESTKKISPS
jgi:hypothetical protein